MAKVLGVGGVFFKSDDPAKLAKWYQQYLNIEIDPSYGGCSFLPDTMPNNGCTVFSPFKADTDYFAPSSKPYMINLVVDNLNEALKQVALGGAELIGQPESFDYGDFGWFMDPDQNKIELWQPK